MMLSWGWVFLSFFVLFLVTPIGYGWGYRRWGPPYPRYVQRRRSERAGATSSPFNHQAWGWGGDVVWLALVLCVVWVVAAPWWR